MATSKAVENTLRTIFRRCVQCPNESPSCPSCSDGQICSQVAASCTECAKTMCVDDPTATTSSNKSGGGGGGGGPNVGAIAGGVVGGVAFIAILTYLVWRFWLKKRRQQFEEEQWDNVETSGEKSGESFTMRRDARASTHTVASMASTVLTRASNIIQIAYIPGVTNRQGPGSPDLLVPPVPPIPAMSTTTAPSSPYSTEDQIFFAPGDLRDSTFSDGYSERSSIAPSLARSSVATTIYRSNAIVSPMPASTAVRGKAAVVSVKSSTNNSPLATPGSETPPVPSVDSSKLSVKPIRIQMPRQFSGNSLSPASSMKSATVGKPVALNIVKKKSGESSRTVAQTPQSEKDAQLASKSTAADSESESDADDHSKGLLGGKKEQSPFSDAASLPTVAEESHRTSTGPDSKDIDKGPFSDDHAVDK